MAPKKICSLHICQKFGRTWLTLSPWWLSNICTYQLNWLAAGHPCGGRWNYCAGRWWGSWWYCTTNKTSRYIRNGWWSLCSNCATWAGYIGCYACKLTWLINNKQVCGIHLHSKAKSFSLKEVHSVLNGKNRGLDVKSNADSEQQKKWWN